MALYDWQVLCAAVRSADRAVKRRGRKMIYSDQQIVKMMFWAVRADRPMCWACERASYAGGVYRPRALPSVSQFCRRLKSRRVATMIAHVSRRLCGAGGSTPTRTLSVDGKALPISDYSRDVDATNGWGTGRFQKGYKLHGCVDDALFFKGFEVHPMNVSEPAVARGLPGDSVQPGVLALADANYDSSPLHAVCRAGGGRFVTPLKGRGRSRDRLQKMDRGRRELMEMWETRPEEARRLLHHRDGIERAFAHLVNAGDGLKGLPSWVRGLERVRRWVTAKIAFYHARLIARRDGA